MTSAKAFDESVRIGILGVGVMGTALVKGMINAGLVTKEQFFASVNTQRSKARVEQDLGIQVSVGYPSEWTAQTDIFLICTKPYTVEKVLLALHEQANLKPGALFLSIAAGLKLEKMEACIPNHAFIRAMPNTPSLIGAGATVLSPGQHTRPEEIDVAMSIFNSVGRTFELPEHHMDAVTAVSGSGPAYMYLVLESLADGAVKVGLPRDVAFQLVSQVMLGAAQMLQETGKHPATLKDEVTTPAGCTISALLTMEDGKIRSTLARAVEEATRTAAGLG
jgi:pyrroline-5-carboxylate reductase